MSRERCTYRSECFCLLVLLFGGVLRVYSWSRFSIFRVFIWLPRLYSQNDGFDIGRLSLGRAESEGSRTDSWCFALVAVEERWGFSREGRTLCKCFVGASALLPWLEVTAES